MKRVWNVLPVVVGVVASATIAIAASSDVSKPTRVHVIELPKTDTVIDTGE